MIKWLLVFAVLWIVWAVVRGPRRTMPRAQPKPRELDQMVECAQCGVHVPRAEAVGGVNHDWFCSEEHRLTHEKAASR